MARAIDGDELQELCNRRIQETWNSGTAPVSWAHAYADFKDDIDSMPTLTPPNEALTMEELREMDGEPVYMTFPSDTGNQCGHWALVGTQRWGAVSLIYGCGWSSYESAVETLGAEFYRLPPEGEEEP